MGYWEDCLDKGDFGELLVDTFLERKGYTILEKGGKCSHTIDRKVQSKSGKINYIDVKTKKHRDLYPDTGFDTPDYYKYIELNKTIKVIIIYVDEYLKGAYFQTLDDMMIERTGYPYRFNYPYDAPEDRKGKFITYTPISSLTKLFLLSPKALAILESLPKPEYE